MSERTQLGMFGVPDRAVKVRRAKPAIPTDVEKVLVALQVAMPAERTMKIVGNIAEVALPAGHPFKRDLALAGFQPFSTSLDGSQVVAWTYWRLEWTT